MEKNKEESITLNIGDTPWYVACKLIEAKCKIINKVTHPIYYNQDVVCNFFDLSELEEIGKHLINYVRTKRGL